MKRLTTILLLVLILISMPATADDEGFRPHWQVGDTWTIEAKYRDVLKPGEDAWLPAIRWNFTVRARKNIRGEPCFVLHITPESSDLRAQTVLCLAESDLHLVEVVDVQPVQGKLQRKTRHGDPARISPISRDGSLVPYDLPMFPLAASRHEDLANIAGCSGEESHRVDGLTFVEQVQQSWKPVEGGFEVTLENPVTTKKLTQVWRTDAPWAVTSQGSDIVCTLVR